MKFLEAWSPISKSSRSTGLKSSETYVEGSGYGVVEKAKKGIDPFR